MQDPKYHHTLEDKLPQQVIQVANTLRENKLIVVGGMAVQAYTQDQTTHRPTDDIDLLPQYPMSVEEFREIAPSFLDAAQKEGISATRKKGHRSYEIEYTEKGTNRPFFAHISFFSPNYWARHGQWKQREIENAQTITHPTAGDISVFRIEDVLANKLRRLRNLRRNDELTQEQGLLVEALTNADIEQVAKQDTRNMLPQIIDYRWNIIQSLAGTRYADNNTIGQYKGQKDLYDIGVLAQEIMQGKQHFEEPYYKESIQSIVKYDAT